MKKRSLSHKHGHRSNPSRSRLKYIGRGQKGTRVVKFTVGNTGDYTHEMSLIAQKERYIPETVLESIRVALSHALKGIGDKYVFRIMPYPHEVLTENKILGTAKAERIAEGMRRSYGKPIGLKAAHVKKKQEILRLWVYEEDIPIAKNALRVVRCKLGFPVRLNIKKSSGSPRVIHKEVEEKKTTEPLPTLREKKGI